MPDKNIVTIIQARMSSTRLPGKVLMDLKGKSVLEHVVDRVKACELVNKVVVATTDIPIDDAIIAECEKIGCDSSRGSSDDVLSRYYEAAKKFNADIVIRITSDCPLLSTDVLDSMVEQFCKTQPDYLSNTIERTFPRGLDIEIMTFETLEKAYKNAMEAYEKEHVTPYIYQHPELFRIEQFTSYEDNSHFRWTLDTEEDWKLIKEVYNSFNNDSFEYDEILDLFKKHPELEDINAHIEQKKLSG